MKTTTALIGALLTLGITACGEDESSEESEATVSPAQAITEIAAVRHGIEDALKSYKNDDQDAAVETVDETYLQHFELVEGPLEEADPELNEELEEQIREELAEAMEQGASVTNVTALTDEIMHGLDTAETLLEREAESASAMGRALTA